MPRRVALALVTARLRRLGHVPSVLTAGLPRGLTRSRVIGPASTGADLAATIAAALDGLAAPMPDPASDDGGFRPARRPSPAASAARRAGVLPGGPTDRRTKVREAVGGPSRLAHRVATPRRPNVSTATPAPLGPATTLGARPVPAPLAAPAGARPQDRPVLISRDAGVAATLRALTDRASLTVGARRGADAPPRAVSARPDRGPVTAAGPSPQRAPTSTTTPPPLIARSSAPADPAVPVTSHRPPRRAEAATGLSSRRPVPRIDDPDPWPAAGHVAATAPPTELTGLVGWWESEQGPAPTPATVGPARRPAADAPAPRPELGVDGDEPLAVFRDALELVLLDEALEAGLEVD